MLEIEEVPIAKLFLSPSNPRLNDAAVPHVAAASLRSVGTLKTRPVSERNTLRRSAKRTARHGRHLILAQTGNEAACSPPEPAGVGIRQPNLRVGTHLGFPVLSHAACHPLSCYSVLA